MHLFVKARICFTAQSGELAVRLCMRENATRLNVG